MSLESLLRVSWIRITSPECFTHGHLTAKKSAPLPERFALVAATASAHPQLPATIRRPAAQVVAEAGDENASAGLFRIVNRLEVNVTFSHHILKNDYKS
jgi:hypothetical protein